MTEMQSPNLAPRRGPSVWTRGSSPNGWLPSAPAGRWMMAAAGTALALSGLRRRGPAGVLLALAGGALAARAAAGLDDFDALQRCAQRYLGPADGLDAVDHTLDDSFPASDPPGWGATSHPHAE
jgi:uncharacterized membrane protein